MKKLTSLQILMLMSLSLGSSYIQSKYDASIDEQNEIAQLTLESIQTENATLDVLEDLAIINPAMVELIVENLDDLEDNFNNIKSFVDRKNKEIDKLLSENSVAQIEVARLAVELANAQAMLDKTIAQHKAKNKISKKSAALINTINKFLTKAERGVKLLNDIAARGMQYAKKSITKSRNVKAHTKQVPATSDEYQMAQQARNIPGVQDEVANNLSAKLNISPEEAHAIINDAFANNDADQMNDQAMMVDDASQASDEVVVQAVPNGSKKQQVQLQLQQARQQKQQQAQQKQQQKQQQPEQQKPQKQQPVQPTRNS